MNIKMKEFPNRIKQFSQYPKIKELAMRIEQFAQNKRISKRNISIIKEFYFHMSIKIKEFSNKVK